jgi:hypothetical protein
MIGPGDWHATIAWETRSCRHIVVWRIFDCAVFRANCELAEYWVEVPVAANWLMRNCHRARGTGRSTALQTVLQERYRQISGDIT